MGLPVIYIYKHIQIAGGDVFFSTWADFLLHQFSWTLRLSWLEAVEQRLEALSEDCEDFVEQVRMRAEIT